MDEHGKRNMKKRKIKATVEEKDYSIHILVFLICAGFFLRFYQLGFNSLWLDEIASYEYAIGTFPEMWQRMTNGTDFNPPLYFVLQHFMIPVFGTTEWGIRLLSAIFGVLTIPVMYLVGKEFDDKFTGLIAAGIITFSPFLIVYSQEARPYAITMFLVSVMVLFYLKAMKSNDVKEWAAVGLFAALSFWSHYYALVIIIALATHLFISRIRKGLNKENAIPLIGAGVFFIAALPLILALISIFTLRTSTAPTFGIQGFGIISSSIVQIFGYTDYAAVIGLIFFSVGCYWLGTRYNGGINKLLFLLLIIGITFITSAFMSYRIPMIPRYLIFLLIPFSLGIAMAYKMMQNIVPDKITSTHIISGIILLFVITGIPFYLQYYQNFTKDDWRGIAQDIESITNNGDTVVTVPDYIIAPVSFYYDPVKDQTTLIGATEVEKLNALKPAQNKRIYYVITSDLSAAEPSGTTLTWLGQNTRVLRNYGSVYLATVV
jgi:mannosyltransferase